MLHKIPDEVTETSNSVVIQQFQCGFHWALFDPFPHLPPKLLPALPLLVSHLAINLH